MVSDRLKEIENKIRTMSLYSSKETLFADLIEDNEWFLKRIHKLTEALEFYAYRGLDPTTIDINGDGKPLRATKFGVDRGELARKALGDE